MTEHQQSDARRDQILNAASRLFVTSGFESTTVEQIAQAAGLSKGAIYWHFKSKLDILFELTDRCVCECQNIVVKSAENESYGAEALYKAHRDVIEQMKKNPDNEALQHQLVSLASRYPEIRERMSLYHRQWDNVTSSLIDRGVKEGVFKPVNGLVIARAIHALHDGLFIAKWLDDTIDPLLVIETVTKLIFDALIIRTPETISAEQG